MGTNERSRDYPGWRVAAVSGVGASLAAIPVLTFAVFLKPLTAEFDWSREMVSRAFGAMTLAVAAAAPFVGHVLDRFGPRWIIGPALAIVATAFASLAALTPDPSHLYAVFVVIGLASSGTSMIAYSRVISSWFDARRGVALASVVGSIGAGAIVYPPLTQVLIGSVGWRVTYLTIGVVMLVLGVPLVGAFVREPVRSATDSYPRVTGVAAHAALRSRVFWTLIVVVFGSTFAMNGVVVHLQALLTDRGVSSTWAVTAMSSMGAASVAGRLVTGWLLDRFSGNRVSFGLLTMAATGTFLLASAHSPAEGIVAALLLGFGTGGEVDVTPYLLSRFFGVRSLAALYGVTWTAFGIASALGPILMGRAFDATHSYAETLLTFSIGTMVVAALMLTLPAYKREQPALAPAG